MCLFGVCAGLRSWAFLVRFAGDGALLRQRLSLPSTLVLLLTGKVTELENAGFAELIDGCSRLAEGAHLLGQP